MKDRDKLIDEMALMLDVFNSIIIKGDQAKPGSDCHKYVLNLLERAGRKPTAGIK